MHGFELDEIGFDFVESILKDKDDNLISSIYYSDNKIIRNNSWKSWRDNQELIYNIHGYRSPEFKKNIDFLFAGCSVTFGQGLDSKYLWHEKLIKNIGGSYASVATPGDSVVEQIFKIFAYIKEFGNPKNILCLFPNFERFMILNDENLLVTEKFNSIRDQNFLKQSFQLNDDQSQRKYFKRPLLANDVINNKTCHMFSFQMINILSQYCKSAEINFIWGTWHNYANILMKSINKDNYFKEYIDLDADKWSYDFKNKIDKVSNKLNCHLEFKNEPFFNLASDISHGEERAHFGFHRHIHYYEKFLERINIQKQSYLL